MKSKVIQGVADEGIIIYKDRREAMPAKIKLLSTLSTVVYRHAVDACQRRRHAAGRHTRHPMDEIGERAHKP